MNSFLKWAGAFVAVALIAFGAGFGMQYSTARTATAAATTCERKLSADETLLSLYRARHELTKSNFGTAGEHLQKAKASSPAPVVAEIERAQAAVAANDIAATDAIGSAIKALESGSP